VPCMGLSESSATYPSPRPLRAARAIVKAMAYKPVGSIDELVRGEPTEEQTFEDLRQVGDCYATSVRPVR